MSKDKFCIWMRKKPRKPETIQNGASIYFGREKIDRYSKEYVQLIESAYRRLLLNDDFRMALLNSKNKILIHTIGKSFRKKTVLTWWEFVRILHKLRKELKVK